jgi:hypothetical protein
MEQPTELHTATLGAMRTTVKQYNVSLNRSAIPARCDARWNRHGAPELSAIIGAVIVPQMQQKPVDT